jgi:hypothetical protein
MRRTPNSSRSLARSRARRLQQSRYTMHDFNTIDTTSLENVHGGNAKGKIIQKGIEYGKKGIEYGKKAGKWTFDNVIKPGAAAVGFDYVWDKATGSDRSAREK